jgi:predicted membrane protein
MISTINAYISQAKHRRSTHTCFTFDVMRFSYIKLMLVEYHLYLIKITILMMMMVMIVVMLLLLLLLSLLLLLLLVMMMVMSKKEEEREINFKVKE